MKFADFDKAKPRDLPLGVSPVYFDLYSRVEQRDGQDPAKVIIFCVAYTLYSTRKKTRIVEIKRDQPGTDVSGLFREFDPDWAQESTINEARDFLDEVITDLKSASVVTIVEEIKKATSKRLPIWWRPFSFIGNAILHVSYIIVGTVIFIAILALLRYFLPDFVDAFVKTVEHFLKLVDQLLKALRPQ